jgi:hypothetical protein
LRRIKAMASPAITFDDPTATTGSARCGTVYYETTAQRQSAYEATVTNRAMAPLLFAMHRGYCEALFERLASESPEELIQIVRDSRGPHSRLTYAAEILGRAVRTAKTAETLLRVLAEHPSPLVREGAVLGLTHHLERAGVRDALRKAAELDPSPGVRRAVAEALEN